MLDLSCVARFSHCFTKLMPEIKTLNLMFVVFLRNLLTLREIITMQHLYLADVNQSGCITVWRETCEIPPSLTYFYPRLTFFHTLLYWFLVGELRRSTPEERLVMKPATAAPLSYIFTLLWAAFSSHLLVLSEQSARLLKNVFSLRFGVTGDPALRLPGPGDAKHSHVQWQHRPASGGRHGGSKRADDLRVKEFKL